MTKLCEKTIQLADSLTVRIGEIVGTASLTAVSMGYAAIKNVRDCYTQIYTCQDL